MRYGKKIFSLVLCIYLAFSSFSAVANNKPDQANRIRLINLTGSIFYARYSYCNNIGNCTQQPLAVVPGVGNNYFDIFVAPSQASTVYVVDVEDKNGNIIGGPYQPVLGSCFIANVLSGYNSALMFQQLTGLVICTPGGGK